MRRLVILSAIIVSGCAHYDLLQGQRSEFRKIGPKEYEFRTIADTMYPDGSPRAEDQRLAMLKEMVENNHSCPSGYSVIDRHAMAKTDVIKDVYYRIRCT